MHVLLGLGQCRVGGALGGYGEPAIVDITKRQDLLTPDQKIGQQRLIDARTGDYVYDQRGYLVGTSSAQNAVYLALKTVKGSSAIPSVGQQFSNLKTFNNNYQNFISNEVNQALSKLISDKVISLNSLYVKQNPNNHTQVIIQVSCTDLASNTIFTSDI